MRYIAAIAAAAVIGLSAGLSAAAEVEIAFAERISKKLDRINRIEIEREANFRRTGDPVDTTPRTAFRFNKARFDGTEWAGERLIADAGDYTVENLLEALVDYNLDRIDAGTEDLHIRLTLNRLKLENSPIAILTGPSSWAKGRVERLDPATGDVLEAHSVSVNFVRKPSVDDSYTGPDLAFLESDGANRIGPVLAQFVAEAMEKIYPETDFADVRMIELVTASSTSILTRTN